MTMCIDDTILHYLRDRMPGYPYDLAVDPDFVQELIEDFPNTDILEQMKTFRWFYDNRPAERVRNIRLALRRWIARAAAPYP